MLSTSLVTFAVLFCVIQVQCTVQAFVQVTVDSHLTATNTSPLLPWCTLLYIVEYVSSSPETVGSQSGRRGSEDEAVARGQAQLIGQDAPIPNFQKGRLHSGFCNTGRCSNGRGSGSNDLQYYTVVAVLWRSGRGHVRRGRLCRPKRKLLRHRLELRTIKDGTVQRPLTWSIHRNLSHLALPTAFFFQGL